jgi:hypothetical protein
VLLLLLLPAARGLLQLLLLLLLLQLLQALTQCSCHQRQRAVLWRCLNCRRLYAGQQLHTTVQHSQGNGLHQ